MINIIKLIEKEKIIDMRSLMRRSGFDKDFILYLIQLINKQSDKHITIKSNKIYASNSKCSKCPFYH